MAAAGRRKHLDCLEFRERTLNDFPIGPRETCKMSEGSTVQKTRDIKQALVATSPAEPEPRGHANLSNGRGEGGKGKGGEHGAVFVNRRWPFRIRV